MQLSKLDKKGKANNGIIIGILAVAIIAIVALFASGTFNVTGDGTTVIQTDDTEESSAVTMSSVELYNPTTTLTGVTYTYYEDGVKSTDTDGSFTAYKGKDYDVLVAKSGYVAQAASFSFDGSEQIGTLQYKLADLMDLSAAITVYNKDGSENGASARYAVGEAEAKNIEFEISGASKDVFPGGVIVFEANKTAIADVRFNEGTAAQVPQQYTASSVGVSTYAFTFPMVEDVELITAVVTVVAEDGVNPGNESITYTIYDAQVYIDSKTDELVTTPAVEDSDKQDVGAAQTVGTIYLS